MVVVKFACDWRLFQVQVVGRTYVRSAVPSPSKSSSVSLLGVVAPASVEFALSPAPLTAEAT